MKRRDFVGKIMMAGGMVTPFAAMSKLRLSGKKSGINPDPDNEEEIVIACSISQTQQFGTITCYEPESSVSGVF